MRKVISLSCILFVVSLSGCPSKLNPWTFERVVCVDGVARTYYVHPHSTYDGTCKSPLLIALHPFLCTPADMETMTGFSKIANREGFIVVYPEGLGLRWNDGSVMVPYADDVAFIRAVIDDVSTEYLVDENRVYICGASNGAFMTNRLVCEMSDRFAAAAVVMGAPMPAVTYDCCYPPVGIPMMMIHGTRDPIVPFNGGDVMFAGRIKICFKSFYDTMWLWVDRNCLEPSGFMLADLPEIDSNDGTCVTEILFEQGNPEAPVHCYVIHGGGHTWPGSNCFLPQLFVGKVSHEFNASETIWSFFRGFPRNQPVDN